MLHAMLRASYQPIAARQMLLQTIVRHAFSEAFPNGDPHGHRIAHEKAIRNASWWDKIKSEAASKTITAGLWVTMAFIAAAIWEHIKSEARK